MEYRPLGRLGFDTSVLVYGAAALAEVSQAVADESIQAALDAEQAKAPRANDNVDEFDAAAPPAPPAHLAAPTTVQ